MAKHNTSESWAAMTDTLKAFKHLPPKRDMYEDEFTVALDFIPHGKAVVDIRYKGPLHGDWADSEIEIVELVVTGDFDGLDGLFREGAIDNIRHRASRHLRVSR